MPAALTNDLTAGRPLPKILRFAVPLVFGTLFQQFYSVADTAIVGRFLGVDALAAVGCVGSLQFLVLGFVMGTAAGFGVQLAQSFGAKDAKQLGEYFWNGCYLAAGLSLALAAVTLAATTALLTAMRTPENILPMAVGYIRVIFAGIPVTMLYNYSAAALRAVGDSRHPFFFLLLGTVLNIVLDWLFIVPLHGGVASAALATVLSQLVSGALTLWWLFARTGAVPGWRGRAAVNTARIKRLCRVGLPMGFEYSVSAVGALVLQGAINTLGSVAVAAQTTGEKIRQLFTMPMESVGTAMATYAGQNCGAKRYDRVRQGLRAGLTIQWTYCAAAWVVIYFVKAPAVYLVLGETASPAAQGAIEYLARISALFCFHGALMVFRHSLQGLGYSLQAILGGVGELIGRAVGGMLAVGTGLGFVAVCYANPLAWVLSMIYCACMLFHYLRRLEKQG